MWSMGVVAVATVAEWVICIMGNHGDPEALWFCMLSACSKNQALSQDLTATGTIL